MKICFCVSSFPALSQTFVTAQVLYALRQGHEVTVACKSFQPDTPLSAEQTELLKSARIVIWPRPKPPVLGLLPTGLSDRIVARLDRMAWRRQIDADLVIAHFGYRGAAVARAQHGWTRRPPLITVFHGRDVSVEYQRNGLSKYRDLFSQGDLHVTVNAPFAQLLQDCGAPADRVETRHLGIPVSGYVYAPPVCRTSPRFLSVCRLVEKKGLATAITALALLRERNPELDWRYDIAGDGPLAEDLRQQAKDAGLTDRINFLGALPHHETLRHISNADVLLVPSCTARDGDQEGIPVTLMEAMALGTPVATTRHSGIPELVSDGETGLLSDENDARGLCENLFRLATEPDFAHALASAARARVVADFNEDRQNAGFLERCLQLGRSAE